MMASHLQRSLTIAAPPTFSVSRPQGDDGSATTQRHHDNPKYLPTIKERNKAPKCYIYGPSHKEEGKLAIPSKRPTDYSL